MWPLAHLASDSIGTTTGERQQIVQRPGLCTGQAGLHDPSNCPLGSLGIQSIRECAVPGESCMGSPGAPQEASVDWSHSDRAESVEEREELHGSAQPRWKRPATDNQTGREEDATPNGVITLCLKGLGPGPRTTHLYLTWLTPGPGTQSSPASRAFSLAGPCMKSQLETDPCAYIPSCFCRGG